MAKQTILNEATVRRFMKLASIDKLSESYFDEIKEEEEQVEESKDEEVNEIEVAEDDKVDESADTDKEPVDEEISLPEEQEEEEMGGEMELDAADPAAEEDPAGDQTAEVAAALQTIADALGAAGIDVSVEDSSEEEAPLDAELAPEDEEPEMAQEAESETGKPVLDEEYYQSVKEQVIARMQEEFSAKIQEDNKEEIQEDKEESQDEE